MIGDCNCVGGEWSKGESREVNGVMSRPCADLGEEDQQDKNVPSDDRLLPAPTKSHDFFLIC